jgi:hypothetical protein
MDGGTLPSQPPPVVLTWPPREHQDPAETAVAKLSVLYSEAHQPPD